MRFYPTYEKYWNPAKRKGYAGTTLLTKIHPQSVKFGMDEKKSILKEGALRHRPPQ